LRIDNAGCPHGCNSLGQILFHGEWHPCPIHGHQEKGLLLDGKLPNGESLFDVLQIPYDYRGKWENDTSEMFKNPDINDNCFPESVTQLKFILETLFNVIGVENNIYLTSLYLYANPNLLDLRPFMYSLQRVAFENNIAVLPAISVNDLGGLLALQDYSAIRLRSEKDVETINSFNRLAGQGADWSLRTNLTYTDYLRSSLCFVTDSPSSTDQNIRSLAGFIEDRGQRGLPTYVFSTSFFDMKRESLLYNKSGVRKLSALTPYLLMGRNQEIYAREHGWLKNKQNSDVTTAHTLVTGYTLADFGKGTANTFDL